MIGGNLALCILACYPCIILIRQTLRPKLLWLCTGASANYVSSCHLHCAVLYCTVQCCTESHSLRAKAVWYYLHSSVQCSTGHSQHPMHSISKDSNKAICLKMAWKPLYNIINIAYCCYQKSEQLRKNLKKCSLKILGTIQLISHEMITMNNTQKLFYFSSPMCLWKNSAIWWGIANLFSYSWGKYSTFGNCCHIFKIELIPHDMHGYDARHCGPIEPKFIRKRSICLKMAWKPLKQLLSVPRALKLLKPIFFCFLF